MLACLPRQPRPHPKAGRGAAENPLMDPKIAPTPHLGVTPPTKSASPTSASKPGAKPASPRSSRLRRLGFSPDRLRCSISPATVPEIWSLNRQPQFLFPFAPPADSAAAFLTP